jgi:hypothetical protein
MVTDKNKNERPFAYPKPTETDQQLNNQPEYLDQQPNSSGDEELDGKPATNDFQQANKEDKKN